MAFEAMESLFDLDLTTTAAQDTGSTKSASSHIRERNHPGAGVAQEMMDFLLAYGTTGKDGKIRFPFCVDVCVMKDVLNAWRNLSLILANLQTSLIVLETCLLILAVVFIVVASVGFALLIYFIRKQNASLKRVWSNSPSHVSLTVPSSMSTNIESTVKPVDKLPPPPSRQSGDSRSPTPTPFTWVISVDNDTSAIEKSMNGQRIGTPMPLEINDDMDDDRPMSMPTEAPATDVRCLSAKHNMGRAITAMVAPGGLTPLNEHPNENE